MTRRPEEWSKIVTCEMQRPSKKKQMMTYGNVNHPATATEVLQTVKGTLSTISSDPSDVIPQADIIVLCMPVHQYRNALKLVAPYIDRKKENVFVGTVYGQAGFNWMVHEVEKNYDLQNICTFACGLIPWICRTVKYGKIGANYGTKAVNVAAVTPRDKFSMLNEIFFKDIAERWHEKGAFHQACSFLSLTLSVDNQIVSITFVASSSCFAQQALILIVLLFRYTPLDAMDYGSAMVVDGKLRVIFHTSIKTLMISQLGAFNTWIQTILK